MQGTTVHAGIAPDSVQCSDISDPIDELRQRRMLLCRRLIAERQYINRFMTKRFHSNADFSMLLAVYLAEAESRDTYQWEVAQAGTIASSTAHRKLGEMIQLGLLARKRTVVDRRLVCLVLADETRVMLDALLDRLDRDSRIPPDETQGGPAKINAASRET